MYEEEKPLWAGRTLNEHLFCQDFLLTHNLICVDGQFYSHFGRVTDEGVLRKEIYDTLKHYFSTGLQSKVDNVIGALRLETHLNRLPISETRIHLKNGTYHLANGFSETMEYCRHRLPVRHDPANYCPKLWLEFLDQLLEKEDIDTLQEYMGYCLLPTNKAQKMLLITGQGGEGKSRIGVVMKAILGENMCLGSLAKVEHNRFARADLEHMLVMVDDDLRLEALNSTNYIKSIISADLPQDLERKGQQSYQGKLYVRFLAFGNGTLESLHDRSYGFYRRQIILSAKPRDPNRVDDPYLGERLADEADSIFLWALFGLHRLFENDFQFTISQKSKDNWKRAVENGNNILGFLESDGYIALNPKHSCSTRQLYAIYRDWCADNAMKAFGEKYFSTFLSANAQNYGLVNTNNIYIANGRRVRGYQGIGGVLRP